MYTIRVISGPCIYEAHHLGSGIVELLITHTSRWTAQGTAQGMGYEGLWVCRGMLKTDSKNPGKIVKIIQKILRLQACAKSC